MWISFAKNKQNGFYFFIFFILFFFFFPQKSFSFCPCPCSCTCYMANKDDCDFTKGPLIYRGMCLDGCCPCSNCPATPCGGQSICEDCGTWQIATRIISGENVCQQSSCRATRWNNIKPECKACDKCLKEPKNPRYFDNVLCPLNPFEPEDKTCKSKDPNNIYLPVKLDWEDVEGWIEGWRLPDKKVVKKDYYGERCEITFEAGKDLVDCQVNCKNECWKKMEQEWKGPEKNPGSKWNIGFPSTAKERAEKEVKKEWEYRAYLHDECIRKCELKCVEDHKINSSKPCPYTGTIFHCDPDTDYVKSYIIEIKGNMRNPEALQKIEILERENELLTLGIPKFLDEKEVQKKVLENEEKIKKIKDQELEIDFWGEALPKETKKSEFIPPSAAFFKSNREYQWRVRACIKEYKTYKEYQDNGEFSCGPWSEWWRFKTNPAPEPKLPYDPDWNGRKEHYPSGWSINGKGKEMPKWEIRFARWAEIVDKEFSDEKNPVGMEKICRKWFYNKNPEKTEKEKGAYEESVLSEKKKVGPTTEFICRQSYCYQLLKFQRTEPYVPEAYCRPRSHNFLFYYRYEDLETENCPPVEKQDSKCVPQGVYASAARGWPSLDPIFPLPQFYNQSYRFFTKLTTYSWKVDACITPNVFNCTDWSQKWQFSGEDFTLEKPRLETPPNTEKTPTGIPLDLTWTEVWGALSYRYEVREKDSDNIVTEGWVPTATKKLENLKLDHKYKWRVMACWDYKAEKCENVWSDWFVFKTTGEPPKETTMKPEGQVNLPVEFQWQPVSGAKSYCFFLAPTDESRVGAIIIKRVEEPRTELDFPDLVLGKEYNWHIQSCSTKGGPCETVAAKKECGKESQTLTLNTLPFWKPVLVTPSDGENLVAGKKFYNFSWVSNENARFHQIEVEYLEKSPKEIEEKCKTGLVFKKETEFKESSLSISLSCLGKYRWRIRDCLGGNICQLPDHYTVQPLPYGECCQSPHLGSEWSEATFELLPAPPPPSRQGGIIPCGRKTDNPNTPWDETKPCEIKHLFVLLRNIITFFFEFLIPVSLLFLVVATGLILYFQHGLGFFEERPVDIKNMWKTAGKAYLLIFLAWLIVNLVLVILGYQFGIFGHWFQIKF